MMASRATPPPPNDINRLAQAWTLLQALVNVTLPLLSGRAAAVRGRLPK